MIRLELLKKWGRIIVRLQIEHEVRARDFEKFNWKLGIPCVVLSAVLSASVFSSIRNSSLLWFQYVAGLISILTLVLGSIQTFLNFDTRTTAHNNDNADKLGTIAREVQDEIASGQDEAALALDVSDIRNSLDSILFDSPTFPKSTIRKLRDARIYEKARLEGQDMVPI
ncbi:SLATT domain-containing protein [Pseudomonas frederiksbergensis]|uniref:SLATT domain-containing protein n=1 Tax=Pseudomonas frederiksbergensis TaxID=104087 RepID=UPI003D23ECAC